MTTEPLRGPAGVPGESDAQRRQVAQLAQEFEAMLMTQMLRDMQKTMLSDESERGGLGSGAMFDMVNVELGRALTQTGGFGLSHLLTNGVERAISAGGSNGDPAAALPRTEAMALPASRRAVAMPRVEAMSLPGTPAIPVPARAVARATAAIQPRAVVDPGDSELVVPQGRVTSKFGWRHDPINGTAKFHHGIDVAQPIGRDVQAAAAGRVTAAGPAGGYGLMVQVDHGNGQQTRYAHLSELGVKVGDVVDAGHSLGKTGNTGRSTGPHLHFEVMSHGKSVDPSTEPSGSHD